MEQATYTLIGQNGIIFAVCEMKCAMSPLQMKIFVLMKGNDIILAHCERPQKTAEEANICLLLNVLFIVGKQPYEVEGLSA